MGPNEIKKHISTLEQSLTKLKGKKALLDKYDYDFDADNVRLRTDVNGYFEDEGAFEEDESWTPRKKEENIKKCYLLRKNFRIR